MFTLHTSSDILLYDDNKNKLVVEMKGEETHIQTATLSFWMLFFNSS